MRINEPPRSLRIGDPTTGHGTSDRPAPLQQGEHALLNAVLDDARRNLTIPLSVIDPVEWWNDVCWVLGLIDPMPDRFSFAYVCDQLGFDPDDVRREITTAIPPELLQKMIAETPPEFGTLLTERSRRRRTSGPAPSSGTTT